MTLYCVNLKVLLEKCHPAGQAHWLLVTMCMINMAVFCIIKLCLWDQNHTVQSRAAHFLKLPSRTLIRNHGRTKCIWTWRVFLVSDCGHMHWKNLQECVGHHSPPVTFTQHDASGKKKIRHVFPRLLQSWNCYKLSSLRQDGTWCQWILSRLLHEGFYICHSCCYKHPTACGAFVGNI